MNQLEVPKGALTIRLTPRVRARIDRLTRKLDTTQTAVVNIALAHLAETLDRGEPVHTFVSAEQEDRPT